VVNRSRGICCDKQFTIELCLIMLAGQHLLPVVATKPKQGNRWRPVKTVTGLVNVSGGFSNVMLCASSISITTQTITQIFVQLDKNAHWFLKGVGGLATQKGTLKCVEVMADIRRQFRVACGEPAVAAGDGDEEEDVAVADDVADDEADPMDSLQEVKDEKPAPKKKPQKTKSMGAEKSQVHDIIMPSRPACAAAGQTDTVTITVYRKAKVGRASDPALYLKIDCLNWLLSYAADELHFQGVTPSLVTDPQSRLANVPACKDLRMEWDFQAQEWKASFVAGPFANTTKRFSPNAIGASLWGEHMVVWGGGCFSQATRGAKKEFAKKFLVRWCEAVVAGECKAFEIRWGCNDANMCTPPKKRRKNDDADIFAVAMEEDAVVDDDAE
jgi:hypothetical protein